MITCKITYVAIQNLFLAIKSSACNLHDCLKGSQVVFPTTLPTTISKNDIKQSLYGCKQPTEIIIFTQECFANFQLNGLTFSIKRSHTDVHTWLWSDKHTNKTNQ